MELCQEKVSKIYFNTVLLYNQTLNDLELGFNGLAYLASRGISQEIANKYSLGFAPHSKKRDFLFTKFVREMKYTAKELLEINLLSINITNGTVCDYFGSQRIIFPVFENGQPTSFSSRSILNEVDPRYKSLKYNKLGIFNIDVLNQNPKEIYLVEGAIDAISLEIMGFSAVGILGLSIFGKEHIKPFLSYKGKIIILFDNEENGSGFKGMNRVGNIFLSNGVNELFYKVLPRSNGEKKVDINQFMHYYGSRTASVKLSGIQEERLVIQKEERIREFRKRVDEPPIYDVVSQYTVLKKESSGRYRGICPFPSHADNTPSFIVYEESNRFCCYGCGRKGRVFDFIMELKNMSFSEALREYVK